MNESHSIHGENVSLALGGEGGTKGMINYAERELATDRGEGKLVVRCLEGVRPILSNTSSL